MRVLIVHSFYRQPGGEDNYVRNQVALLKEHHDVHLLDRHNSKLRAGPSAVSQMAWSPGVLNELTTVIKNVRPNVIHLHNAYPSIGPAAHLASKRLGVPLVMTVHNRRLRCPNGLMFTNGASCRRCEGGKYRNAVLQGCFPGLGQSVAYASSLWLHRFVLRLEDHVSVFVAPSEFMRTELLSWGIEADRIALVTNFVEVPIDASNDVGAYGLYVGRLSAEKGLFWLLDALREAGDPPFQIVGEGPIEDALRRRAHALDLTRIVFCGRVSRPDMGKVLRGARFVVIPSLCDENAPLVALEAMAEARPLIVATGGGLPELVRSGAGLICQRGDVAGMAERIRELSENEELCHSLGSSALRKGKTQFSPDVHRVQLESVYTKAAALGPRPRD